MLAGQVVSGEHLLDGGLRAGRVACERAVSFIFFKTALVEVELPAKSADYILTAQLNSPRWLAVR